jgi:hypothetical protein
MEKEEADAPSRAPNTLEINGAIVAQAVSSKLDPCFEWFLRPNKPEC